MNTKQCCTCHDTRPLDEFYKNRGKKDGLSPRCKECSRTKGKELRAKYKRENENPDLSGTKVCIKCHKEKPRTEFYFQRDTKDGITAQCQDCSKERSKKWIKDNPEKSMKWYWENREYSISLNREWKDRNADYVKQYKHKYNKEHKKEIQEYRKDYLRRNREKIKKHRRDTLDQTRITRQRWAKNNPELVRARGHRHRAKVRGNGGSYTADEWAALCDSYGRMCLSCGKHHNEEPLTVDHVIPVSKNGFNYIFNIQPLCLRCNQSKGVKSTDYRTLPLMHGKVRQYLCTQFSK